jgi:2'-5' RNA ligase
MTRLFAALEIPENIRQKIIDLRNEVLPDSPDLKWESPEKIHLTIKFIGEVADDKVDPIINSLDFLEQYEKIQCRLTKFGFFINHGIPQILWIGLWVDSILYNIVEQLNINLAKFDVPVEERKFKPHLTLLRIKRKFPEKWVTNFNSFIIPEIDFISDNIILIKSELLPETSRYTVLKKFNLK